jgi:ComF family protein
MAMVSALTKLGRVAIDMLFPPRCVGCGSFGAFLCQRCEEDLPPAGSPRCPVCWQPYKGPDLCPRCRRERPAFAGLRSPYIFRETVRELVHGLKYNHQSVLALPIASLLSRYLVKLSVPADVLIPVPLYPRRERVRGYNQSALLARELGRITGLPVQEKALTRERNTPSQAESAGAEARKLNVKGAFRYRGEGLQERTVLLVDDVATTGATIDACARVLRDSGAASVWAVTFARED